MNQSRVVNPVDSPSNLVPDDRAAVELLRHLVAIPSVSGDEQAATEFLVKQMGSLGFEAHRDEAGNAVGIRSHLTNDGRIDRTIVLLGHIDTVPGEIPVRIEDHRLFGRGSVDAKGPLATFVVAAARSHLPPGTRLVVIGAVEEEAATSKGARHAAATYQPDTCIIGEPSGWDGVTLGYKGRVLVDYEFQQPESHSAGPEATPAETAIHWWNLVRAYTDRFNQDRQRLFDQLLPSLRKVHSGSDGLTAQVRATAGFRLPPEFELETLRREIRSMAGAATVSFRGYEPAWQSPRHLPLVNALSRAIRSFDGQPRFKHKTGTSDMNVVGPIWRCPIVAYGPGDSALDHTPNEHLVVDDYLRAISVLSLLLNRADQLISPNHRA